MQSPFFRAGASLVHGVAFLCAGSFLWSAASGGSALPGGAETDRPEESPDALIQRIEGLMDSEPVAAMELAEASLRTGSVEDEAIEAAVRIRIAALAREQGDLVRAEREAVRARGLAEKRDDRQLLAAALNEMVGIRLREGRIEEALLLAEESLGLWREEGNFWEIARILNNIGLIHSQTGNYAQALAYYLESLQLKEEIGDEPSAAATLNNRAVVWFEMGQYDRSQADLVRARAIYEKSGDRMGLADVLDNLGRTKREQGKLDEALDLHLSSLELERQLGRPDGIAISLNHAGLVYNRLGRHEDALRSSEDALVINRSLGIPRGLAFSLLHLGVAHFRLGNSGSSAAALEEGVGWAVKAGDRALLRDLQASLAEVKADQGLFAEAYSSLWEARRLDQLVISREIAGRMAELEAGFEIDKRDRQIELLRLERELQQVTIERNGQQIQMLAQENRLTRLTRNSLIGAFAGLAACLVILHSRYRLKRGIEQALRNKNAENVRQREMVEAQGRKIGEANRELHLTNMKLRELSRAVEQSPTGVLITDRAGAITYVNPRFTEVTGYSLDDVRGANPRIFQSGHHGRDFYRRLWSTILTGRVWRGRLVNRRKDGTLYEEDATISPVINEMGEIFNLVAVLEFLPSGSDGSKSKAASGAAPASDGRSIEQDEWPPDLKVLAFVDLRVNRRIIEVLLEALSIRVIFVSDETGMAAALSEGAVDLLFLDLDAGRRAVPEMIRTIRCLDPGGRVPIVCLADGVDGAVESWLAAGAEAVLTRPVRLVDLRNALTQRLRVDRV